MLTRKHFIEIAKILNEHKANRDLINSFCDYLRLENNDFDRERFKTASLNDAIKITENLKN